MRRLDAALTLVEDVLAWASVAILAAVAAIVSADVLMRYLFNQPFSWAYDLISIYLMGALFYFALSRAFSLNAHIGVDIVQRRLPRAARFLCQSIVGLLSLLLFQLILWVNFRTSLGDFLSDAAVVGEIPWPTWISTAIVVLGCAVISLRMVLYVMQNAMALLGNPDMIAQLEAARPEYGVEGHAE